MGKKNQQEESKEVLGSTEENKEVVEEKVEIPANTEPTSEQISAYQKQMKSFYEKELPFLRKMSEYERLRAEVVESKIKRLTYERQLAMMNVPPPSSKDLQDLADKKKKEEEVVAAAIAKKNEATNQEEGSLKVVKENPIPSKEEQLNNEEVN